MPKYTYYNERMRSDCELLGAVGIGVQMVEALFILSMLLWKRSRERPMRPLLKWWGDVCKQVVASLLVHMANVLWSQSSEKSQCEFYLGNLFLDTTGGTVFVYFVIEVFGRGGDFYWELFEFLGAVTGAKISVFIFIAQWPQLIKFLRRWVEKITGGDKNYQAAFVLLFAPLVLNCFQYYVLDSVLIKLNRQHASNDSSTGHDSPLLARTDSGR